MKQIHIQEKKQFKKLFKQDHIDDFEDRFKVLEVFLQTERHMTIDDLVGVARAMDDPMLNLFAKQ